MTERIAPHSQRLAAMRRSRLAERVMVWLLQRLPHGTLVIEEAGISLAFGTGAPVQYVRVHDARTYTALIRRGSIGFGESYSEGWWDVDDLTVCIQFVIRNMAPLLHRLDRWAKVFAPLRDALAALRRRTKASDKADIMAHYDLGNDFYQLMLDPTMMYSCAYFDRPDATLEEASLTKLERLCQSLHLTADDHLLEIGTGWGGLAVYAASVYGCRVTSVTISDAQYDYATARVEAEGLSHLVTILNQDYRDLTGTFDKLVSVEMIEAIGWRQLTTYFETCSRLLVDDGLMALQAIVIEDASYQRTKNTEDFIKNMIFPGGFLPSLEAILSYAGRAGGLRMVYLDDIGRHYAETLKRWRENLIAHQGAFDDLGLGTRFERMWFLYLQYCEAAFLEAHVSDVQVVLAKSGYRSPLEIAAN